MRRRPVARERPKRRHVSLTLTKGGASRSEHEPLQAAQPVMQGHDVLAQLLRDDGLQGLFETHETSQGQGSRVSTGAGTVSWNLDVGRSPTGTKEGTVTHGASAHYITSRMTQPGVAKRKRAVARKETAPTGAHSCPLLFVSLERMSWTSAPLLLAGPLGACDPEMEGAFFRQ